MLGKEGLAYVCYVSDHAHAKALAEYSRAPLDGDANLGQGNSLSASSPASTMHGLSVP